jgi:hypothetical protein
LEIAMASGSSYLKILFGGREAIDTEHGDSVKATSIGLLHRHLTEVLGEKDCALRRSILPEIYLPNCFIAGPDEVMGFGFIDRTRYGYGAINDVARRLHKHRPGYRFEVGDAEADDSGVVAQRWLFGPAAGPIEQIGVEIAICSAGRIEACFSMLDDALSPFNLRQICSSLAPDNGHVENRSHQAWVRDAHHHVASTFP